MFMIWIGSALGLSIFFLFAPSRSRVDVINNNNNNKSLFYLFCFFPLPLVYLPTAGPGSFRFVRSRYYYIIFMLFVP